MERHPYYFWPLLLDRDDKKEVVRRQKKLLQDTNQKLSEKCVIRKRIQEGLDEEYKRRYEERKRRERKKSIGSNR